MARSVNFNLSPTVLSWARISNGYSIEEAAKKIGVSYDRYESWELGENKPTYKQLEDLAENVYRRPLAVLLLKQPIAENNIEKDFRNLTNSQILDFSPEIRTALRKAKRYQLILEEVSESKFEIMRIPDANSYVLDKTPSELAERFRDYLGFSLEEQIKLKSSEEALKHLQRLFEEIGIYIFKMKLPIEEARAFCLTGDYPLIVLNTNDSKNGMIFSIVHEVCHILLNTNDIFKDIVNGNKDPYSNIEDFCNKFSASFLVPDEAFYKDVDSILSYGKIEKDIIETLANKYKVSNEVIARKLLSKRMIQNDAFWSMKKGWDSIAYMRKLQMKEDRKERDGGINQGVKIVYEKGRPFVEKVVSAYESGKISTSDLSSYLETKIDNLPNIIDRLNS